MSVERRFVLCGTGDDIGMIYSVDEHELSYIGTYCYRSGTVYHLFERMR